MGFEEGMKVDVFTARFIICWNFLRVRRVGRFVARHVCHFLNLSNYSY